MSLFYDRLVAETVKEREYLYATALIQDALKGKISRETYTAYLAEAFHHVRHTLPLMMHAGANLKPHQEWMRDALIEYIEEEKGHEEWIINDIKNCGADGEAARNKTPNHATEVMVSYAYDFITRKNAAGFFGMVFVLEGTSTQLATNAAEEIQKTLGLKNNCFSYLLSHGSLDLEHIEFFKKLVNKIESEEDKNAIIHMAKRMFVLFADMFRSVPHNRELSHAA